MGLRNIECVCGFGTRSAAWEKWLLGRGQGLQLIGAELLNGAACSGIPKIRPKLQRARSIAAAQSSTLETEITFNVCHPGDNYRSAASKIWWGQKHLTVVSGKLTSGGYKLGNWMWKFLKYFFGFFQSTNITAVLIHCLSCLFLSPEKWHSSHCLTGFLKVLFSV